MLRTNNNASSPERHVTSGEGNKLYGDFTFNEWNQRWIPVPDGFKGSYRELRHKVGLFRAVLNGEVKVIGSATAYPSGFPKRLAQFRQRNSGGRKHKSGAYIHDELDALQLEVLITGPNSPEAREIALELKEPMIARHNPSENAPRSVRKKIRAA